MQVLGKPGDEAGVWGKPGNEAGVFLALFSDHASAGESQCVREACERG